VATHRVLTVADKRAALGVGVVMTVVLVAFETMAVAASMPAVSDDLNGDRLYGLAFSAYMLANLVTIVAAAERADRRGPLPPFGAGLVLFGAGLVVAGAAGSMVVVVLGRALQGAGAGALTSVLYVAIGRAWPPGEQARMFAWLSAGWVVPSLAAPALAGLVTDTVGWRWVFLGLLPLLPVVALLAGPALRRLGPPSEVARGAGQRRVLTAAALAVGVAVSLTALQEPGVLLLVVPVAAVPAVLAARRLLPPGTWRARRGLPAAVSARLSVNVAFAAPETFLPLAATRLHGASTFVAGAILSAASLSWTAGAAISARARERAPDALVRTGFLVMAASIALTAPIAIESWPLWAVVASWALTGFGIGTIYNTTSASAMSAATEGGQGRVGSQLSIADALGIALASGVGGALVGLADRGSIGLSGALAVVFAGAVVMALAGAARGSRVG